MIPYSTEYLHSVKPLRQDFSLSPGIFSLFAHVKPAEKASNARWAGLARRPGSGGAAAGATQAALSGRRGGGDRAARDLPVGAWGQKIPRLERFARHLRKAVRFNASDL